jgi:hypothetical protein
VNAVEGRIDAPESGLAGRRLLYCVGAQRTGTSWLDSMFRSHPELHVPALKEVHYWDKIRLAEPAKAAETAKRQLERYREASVLERVKQFGVRRPGRALRMGRMLEMRAGVLANRDPGHRDYAEMLVEASGPDDLIVDNTPAYALLGPETFAEMAALADARFVFVMRDPVERLWSGVKHGLRRRIDEGSIAPEQVVARFERAIDADDDPNLARSDYPQTIAALEAAVDSSRVLYLFHETLFSQASYDRVTDFACVARQKVRTARVVNGSPTVAAKPPAATYARARERLAPVYDFVRERFGPDVPATWMQ